LVLRFSIWFFGGWLFQFGFLVCVLTLCAQIFFFQLGFGVLVWVLALVWDLLFFVPKSKK
tara:strand:- start:521 stop:700 length:180 start_codon:yes stop_codon:yes gene_type:complete